MPNHVINEVRFVGITVMQRCAILAKVRGAQEIDFQTLLPIPLNMWMGSVGTKHEKAFPSDAMTWCRENWSTKWNAYGLSEGGRYPSIAETPDSLTLTFQTAWGPPMGWLCALFNSTNLPFEYGWFSEGHSLGRVGYFKAFDEVGIIDAWNERDATDEEHRHLHMLLWGVESFPEEDGGAE